MPKAKLKTGVDLYYEEHGSGIPVILLQGTGFALDVWQPHPVHELAADHRVITIDPRGIGRSPCEDAVLTIDQVAADIVELLDRLAVEPIHVVGHSIGGRIGLELALNYPGRVRSLVMAASGSGAAVRPGEDASPMPQHRLLVRLVERGLKEHVRYEILETEGYFTDKFRADHPDIVEVAVIGRAHEKWGEVPIAVAAVTHDQLRLDDLHAFLTERLARYKHPKSLVIVEALPRNPAGKVLKTELRMRYGGLDAAHDRAQS